MNHYSIGFEIYEHKGKKIKSILGNKKADDYIAGVASTESNAYTYIPNGLEHRPDLLANQVYGSPKAVWMVCLGSNKFDVFEDFDVGSKIGLI
jgi:hypothetical protein